jgi:hypothetical protein
VNARLRLWLYNLRTLGEAVLEREGDAIWLTGKEKHTGEPLSTFYYGRLASYDYIVNEMYAEHAVQRIEEDVAVRAGIRLLTEEAASDVVIGDLSWPYYRGLPRTRFLCVPPRIAHKITLPASWAAVATQFRMRKTTRDELRKIDKFELSYQTTNEAAAFERFYDTMYLPYATERHGDLLDVDSREDLVTTGRHCTLLEVTQRGRVVAGGMLHRAGTSMRFLWLGIIGGMETGLRGASGAALYCFAIQYAISQGCDEMDLRYSPAHLNNGIHRYKRKLGARVWTERRVGRLALRITNLSAAAVAVFSHMPLVVASRGNRLNGRLLITKDNLSPEDIRKLGSYYACAGLERLQIFSTRPLSDDVMHTDYAALDAGLPPLDLHDLTKSTNPAAELCRT